MNIMKMKKLSCLFLIALFVAGFSGCKMAKSFKSFEEALDKTRIHGSGAKALLQAETAYFAGDYQLARELYSRVKNNNSEPLYGNQAIYGLACLRIVRAENTAELRRALAQLTAWQAPESDAFLENPEMLITALNQRSDLFDCQVEIRDAISKKKMEDSNTYKQEIEILKDTIEKLEHQISVLETIDQEIQEKRKPI
ncbi:MAG: hypothetical protein ABR512_10475 [Desulfopila sp.]